MGELNPVNTIGVKGISGIAKAEGIGTVEFSLTDDDGIVHNIKLEGVIYLPQAAKNLISISKWSEDKHDNCGVFSRGAYSIFLWDDDTKRKTISHHPSCKIPLMRVNEDKDEASIYFNKCASVIDNSPLINNGIPPVDDIVGGTGVEGEIDSDQQSDDVDPHQLSDSQFVPGSVVKSNISGNPKISIITKAFRTTVGH